MSAWHGGRTLACRGKRKKKVNHGSTQDQNRLQLTLKHLSSIHEVKNQRHRFAFAQHSKSMQICSVLFSLAVIQTFFPQSLKILWGMKILIMTEVKCLLRSQLSCLNILCVDDHLLIPSILISQQEMQAKESHASALV